MKFLGGLLPLALFVTVPACGTPLGEATHVVKERVSDAADSVEDVINDKPLGLRKTKCDEAGGRWIEFIEVGPCVEGATTLMIDGVEEQQQCDGGEGDSFKWMCGFEDASHRTYFNDGPSVPPSILTASTFMGSEIDQIHYIDLFFDAGVNHDYCYHHGAIMEGLTQEACDERFFSDLSALCRAAVDRELPWFAKDTCRTYAAILYGALRAGGESSFQALNTRVNTPPYRPAWQELGLPDGEIDDELRQKVDEALETLHLN